MSEKTDHVVHRAGYSKGLELTLSMCACYTLCVLTLRLFIRWKAFNIDDFLVSFSTALAFVFFGSNYASSAAGLGRPYDTLRTQQESIEKLNVLALVSNLSWITALCLSKLAIVSMLLRTTQMAFHQRLQYFVGALVSAQCIVSIILMVAGCTNFESLSWNFQANETACPSQDLRWRVITGLDIATEAAILILPLQLVWKLRMSLKNKLIVIVAFWLRIPAIIFTVFRNEEINSLGSATDVSLAAAMVVIWQAIEMSYSIAAATIAALKRLTESLNTGFGHGELMRVHGRSQSYNLSDRSKSLKDSRGSKPSISVNTATENVYSATLRDDKLQQLKLRPEGSQNNVIVSSPPKRLVVGERPVQSTALGDKNIRYDVQYSVHYDEDPLVSRENHQK